MSAYRAKRTASRARPYTPIGRHAQLLSMCSALVVEGGGCTTARRAVARLRPLRTAIVTARPASRSVESRCGRDRRRYRLEVAIARRREAGPDHVHLQPPARRAMRSFSSRDVDAARRPLRRHAGRCRNMISLSLSGGGTVSGCQLRADVQTGRTAGPRLTREAIEAPVGLVPNGLNATQPRGKRPAALRWRAVDRWHRSQT